MPEIKTLRCDWARCQKTGIYFRLSSDHGDHRKIILCPEHSEPLLEIFKHGDPDDESGKPRRRTRVDSKEGLLARLAPDEQ